MLPDLENLNKRGKIRQQQKKQKNEHNKKIREGQKM